MMRDKNWFNENVTIGVTKLRLQTWTTDNWVTVLSLDDDLAFKGEDISGEKSKYLYEDSWNIITDVIFIVDPQEQAIQDSYYQREIDGVKFYRAMRANLVKQMLIGALTPEDVDLIDLKVERAIGKMITGDWISTKYRVEETTVEGAYTQEYKDDLLTKINIYISENYDF